MNHQNSITPLEPHQNRNLDTIEAAQFLGVVPAQIVKLRSAGILPAVVLGPKCIRHRLSDLIAYRDGLLRGGDGTPAGGSVHPNLIAARAKVAAARAKRPKTSAPQVHPAPLPKDGETPNA